jgi:hypothetical protein
MPQLALVPFAKIPTAQGEHAMILDMRPACLALALAAVAGPACAQTWVYEPDTVYRSRVVVQERYIPRAAYRAYAYEPVVATRAYRAYAYEPVVAAPVVARRTVVSRTVVRDRIIRERIVTEAAVPAATVVTRPAVAAYAYTPAVTDAYAWAPPRRSIAVTEAYAYAPIPARVVTPVPVVRYVDPLAVDPITGVFLSDR